MAKFKKGDVVCLKSTDKKMTAKTIKGGTIWCEYFNENEQKFEPDYFSEEELKLCDPSDSE